jgi:lipid A disaccharide synthetase
MFLPPGVRKVMIGPPEIWAWQVNAIGRAVGRCLDTLPSLASRPFSTVKSAYVAAYRGPLALASYDDLLCLTPMNAEAYGDLKARKGSSTKVIQLPHPVLDSVGGSPRRTTASLRLRLGLHDSEHLLGIFPGSREGEIRRMLPTMLAAALQMMSSRRYVRTVVSIADADLAAPITECLNQLPGPARERLCCTDCPAIDLLGACCHALLSTGTLTLEAALLGVRGTAAYAVPRATRFLLRPLFRHGRIKGCPAPFALPNAVLAWCGMQREALPYRELTLGHFRPKRIVRAMESDLPTGPHGSGCSQRLEDSTVRMLREALVPSAGAISAGQYVVQALRESS